MTKRISWAELVPDGYQAVLGLEKYTSSKVEPTVLKLVKIRASMTNGCAFCIDMHTEQALKRGETTRRLMGLAAWYESTLYDERERAALALTDAVTTLGEHGVPDDVWDDAVKHWGEEGTADLLLAIATINVWNRMMVACRIPA
ncbi:AhpD family alkylhydroperoxidase [Kribbella voronezhensis]|uniref:AhpD family alkylhydroperoxidase n=1 Tax=Kribbella voronezhensis TaxID=2512212 RepID=A0A4R7T8Z6_9ACTN|nr:carboxymuconolactone decarboxylase family protein [Kribbella voronezhensis]TDU87647.1 AhpD family alkylhydroperoxidase [Kribbella voronezhensis]